MRASALCVRRGVIVFGSGSIVGKSGGALQTRETIQSKNEQSNHAGIVWLINPRWGRRPFAYGAVSSW
jgi:hypothetical protein